MQIEKSAFDLSLQKLLAKEKDARLTNDYNQSLKISKAIVTLCLEAKKFKELLATAEVLCKRRGQYKKSQIELVQGCMSIINEHSGRERTQVIQKIRDVCQKKIFLQVQYARCVMMLVKQKQGENEIGEAAKILQEVQVQTYGSMDRREKLEFILYQMKIMYKRKDYVRFFIISKKISDKNFDQPNMDLRLQYLAYMAMYFNHQKDYLMSANVYKDILDLLLLRKDLQNIQTLDFKFRVNLHQVFNNFVAFWCMQVHNDKLVPALEDFKKKYKELFSTQHHSFKLANSFISKELVQSNLSAYQVQHYEVFSELQGHQDHLNVLRQRLLQHNIRIISLYYQRIQLERMAVLTNCPLVECQTILCRLMNIKLVSCSIDRIAGQVDFKPKENQNTVFKRWNTQVNKVLDMIDQVGALIYREVETA